MKQVSITIYKFNELSDRARNKASNQYLNGFQRWQLQEFDYFTCEYKEKLQSIGFEKAQICYLGGDRRGGNRRGGNTHRVRFTSVVNVDKFVMMMDSDTAQKYANDDFDLYIVARSKSMCTDPSEMSESTEVSIDRFSDKLDSFRLKVCNNIHKDFLSLYLILTSEDNMTQHYEHNGVRFYESGEEFNENL